MSKRSKKYVSNSLLRNHFLGGNEDLSQKVIIDEIQHLFTCVITVNFMEVIL